MHILNVKSTVMIANSNDVHQALGIVKLSIHLHCDLVNAIYDSLCLNKIRIKIGVLNLLQYVLCVCM